MECGGQLTYLHINGLGVEDGMKFRNQLLPKSGTAGLLVRIYKSAGLSSTHTRPRIGSIPPAIDVEVISEALCYGFSSIEGCSIAVKVE
jgi:hypothetical protein